MFARYRAASHPPPSRAASPPSSPGSRHPRLAVLTTLLLAGALCALWLVTRGGPGAGRPEPAVLAEPAPPAPEVSRRREGAAEPGPAGRSPWTGEEPAPGATPAEPSAPGPEVLTPITPDRVTGDLVRELAARAAAQPSDPRLRSRLAQAYGAMGERLLRDGDPDRAVPYLELSVARDHQDRVLLLLAQAQMARREPAAARRTLDRVRERTGAPYHVLRAEALYAEDRLEEALGELEQARALEPRPELEERIGRLRRELGAGTDRSLETRRFRVFFEGREDQAALRLVLASLERDYTELRRRFGTRDFPVTVILYPDRDYRGVTGAPDWAGALYDGKIRAPVGGLTAVDGDYRGLLRHELVHAFVREKGGDAVPRWLHEGLAQHFQGRRLGDFELGSSEIDRLRSPREPADARLYYAQALYRTEFFLDRYGERKLMALLEELGRGASLDSAMGSLVRLSRDRFLEEVGRSRAP